MYACIWPLSSNDTCQVLHKAGFPIDEQGHIGQTPLSIAAEFAHVNIVKYVLPQTAKRVSHRRLSWDESAAVCGEELFGGSKFTLQSEP